MNYVLSDIHGHYDKYTKMLEKIGFSDADTLYVLGDVVDRGPQGLRILQDMMLRGNVLPVIGNHEFMALQCMKFLVSEVTEKSIAGAERGFIEGFASWQMNGGGSTLDEFRGLSREERLDIMDYMGEFALYETVRAAGKDYVLVHAGLSGFSEKRPLDDYTLAELIFVSPDYGRVYYKDKYLVTGHLPTRAILGNPSPDRIYRANGHIAIDCGCGFGGDFGCICLESGEEFYV